MPFDCAWHRSIARPGQLRSVLRSGIKSRTHIRTRTITRSQDVPYSESRLTSSAPRKVEATIKLKLYCVCSPSLQPLPLRTSGTMFLESCSTHGPSALRSLAKDASHPSGLVSCPGLLSAVLEIRYFSSERASLRRTRRKMLFEFLKKQN